MACQRHCFVGIACGSWSRSPGSCPSGPERAILRMAKGEENRPISRQQPRNHDHCSPSAKSPLDGDRRSCETSRTTCSSRDHFHHRQTSRGEERGCLASYGSFVRVQPTCRTHICSPHPGGACPATRLEAKQGRHRRGRVQHSTVELQEATTSSDAHHIASLAPLFATSHACSQPGSGHVGRQEIHEASGDGRRATDRPRWSHSSTATTTAEPVQPDAAAGADQQLPDAPSERDGGERGGVRWRKLGCFAGPKGRRR